MRRRTLLLSIPGWPALAAAADPARAPTALRFPADFGAHPETRTEWWYITGSLQASARLWGFQVTFFRASTGLGGAQAQAQASRFDASQLLFAHAALTDLEAGRLRHDQRIARSGFGIAQAQVGETAITLRDWQLARAPSPADARASRYTTKVASETAGFGFELTFDTTQPVLLKATPGCRRRARRMPTRAATTANRSSPYAVH